MSNTKDSAFLLGAHTSAAGGVQNALLEGKKIGAGTIQLFTSNQKQWQGRQITPEIAAVWKQTLADTGLKSIMSHDSYLINLGSPKPDILDKSRKAFAEEIDRCLKLGISWLNFHPGAALDSGVEECLDRIVESLILTAPLLENAPTRLLIETTAGQGSSVGHQFEHLAYIIQRVEDKVPIGVCMDTCHVFAAGYDVRTPEAWEKTLTDFDRIVGLKSLFAFHLNDSAKGLGSRVDRHKPLGEGEIGWDCFRFLMTDRRTCNLPKYLETPDGPDLWVKEIKELRKFVEEGAKACARK